MKKMVTFQNGQVLESGQIVIVKELLFVKILTITNLKNNKKPYSFN